MRLMRLGAESLDVEQLQDKFRDEFGGTDGVIVYKVLLVFFVFCFLIAR